MTLTIQLVPSTAWWSNVRSEVTKAQWEVCKRLVRDRSGNKCEICGGRGRQWPIECHEIWKYDDVNKVQTLVSLIALCPDCHKITHIGRSLNVYPPREVNRLMLHFRTVNGWDQERVDHEVMQSLLQWQERSRHNWALDITYLKEVGLVLDTYTRDAKERQEA